MPLKLSPTPHRGPCRLGYTCAHECSSPSVLFDCHSLAWVHGKPAVYFLTLTGYLCRHPTPVQPPPGFVCRRDNDTPRNDTLRNHGARTTHRATTVGGRLTARLTAQPPCEDDSRRDSRRSHHARTTHGATNTAQPRREHGAQQLIAQPRCEDDSRRDSRRNHHARTTHSAQPRRDSRRNHHARTTHGAQPRREDDSRRDSHGATTAQG